MTTQGSTRGASILQDATVFLGGGRIASAMVIALHRAGYRKPVIVHDRDLPKLRRLNRDLAVSVEPDLGGALARARMVVLAVRPESVRGLLAAREFAASVNSRKSRRPLIVVSLAAGIPLSQLRARLQGNIVWFRAMPSPVCRTGTGLTALACARSIPLAVRREVRAFFSRIGPVLEVPECQLDAFTAAYSPSHGYHALTALADAAVRIGLSRRSALEAAAHALADGINAWRSGDRPLSSLLREAATPGGIAEAVMAAADRHGYRSAIEKALRAGLARARRNSRP
jgi:pyrroline-5-carboxylate reductase